MTHHSELEDLKILFREALAAMDRPRCVRLAVESLASGTVDLVMLYEQVLAPTLNNMTDASVDQALYIWHEHIRSSIIRSIIEACYPYLLSILDRSGIQLDKGKVVIVSPTDEFHELGARMGLDFFSLAGFQTLFVGANTPKNEVVAGIAHELPDYVVLNVVNYYNAFKIKPIVDEILLAAPGVRVLGCGYAFRHNPRLAHSLGLNGVVDSMADILALGGGQS
jgi:MerR family transcriptional regulator, light-induced transcriptional regulator